MKSVPAVAADFDRIAAALASAPVAAELTRAEQAVLSAIPAGARSALDAGCGDGRLARELSRRGLAIVAIDVSPEMIALARERTAPGIEIDYRVADVMSEEATRTFDAVVSINMVHHLPISVVVPRLAALVAPGGTLVIQDVVARNGLRYLPINVIATLRRRVGRLRSKGATREVERLYDAHGIGETYLAPDAVAHALDPLLPGVRIVHHLEWRYTATWTRQPEAV
ncbi:MAG TPA: class I SAM-dependent methyltransferase [Gemmatimonadaceae bacterium]|nr:class I SAM-dependent methyltransferase [Gemmatimonadaceae bacterium]